MNLREIAKELGVSKATVSAALADNPNGLPFAPETLKRIKDYAASVGYVPNRLAQKIFHPENGNTVGVLFLQDSAVDKNLPLLQECMNVLNAAKIEYFVQGSTPDNFQKAVLFMRGMNIRQIVVLGMIFPESLDGLEKTNGLELFITDYVNDGRELPKWVRCVCITNRREFHIELCNSLVEKGLGPIVFDGLMPWLLELDSMKDGLMLQTATSAEKLFEFGTDLTPLIVFLVKEGRCRTVLMHSDRTAAGIVAGLLDAGIKIPEQVQVFGFDDTDFCDYARVPLTSIQPPTLKHLRKILEHVTCGTELPQVLFAPLELVSRKSTMP